MTVTPKDLAETLRRRHRARIAAEAEERREIRSRLDEAVRDLSDLLAGCRLWLIGSLAHERWGVRSDVDLVVEGLDPDRQAELHRALERRVTPPVDLLRLEELSESFRERVRQEGDLLGDR